MIHYPEKHHDNGYKPQAPPPRHVTSILSPAETCEALVESAVARHHQRIDILFLKVSPLFACSRSVVVVLSGSRENRGR
jgi:hypothetical protein